MRFFRRLYSPRGAAALPLVFALREAGAQTVSVAFSPVADAVAVPLSPWLIGLTGLMLLFLAWRGLGKGLPGRGWPLVAILSLGMLALGSSKSWLPDANAAYGNTVFNLVFPSPTISPSLEVGQDVSVLNATGRTIRVDSVAGPPDNVFFYLSNPTQTPQCQNGLILTPDAGCYVRISAYP